MRFPDTRLNEPEKSDTYNKKHFYDSIVSIFIVWIVENKAN